MRRFEQAIAARRGEARIAEDQKLARRRWARTARRRMFFNCRQVVGAQPFERLRAVAEEELKKADRLLAGSKPGPGFYERVCKANLAAAPAAAAPPVARPPRAPRSRPARSPSAPDDPVRGNPKAPVTIVLFSDFQCPFCARVGPTLDEVQRAYGDKVRIVWKHQPLPFHPNALPAAEAAEAAREQGKFWQMHDRLFAAQRELVAGRLRALRARARPRPAPLPGVDPLRQGARRASRRTSGSRRASARRRRRRCS